MDAAMKRMVQKFVLVEFLSNRLNTQKEVDDMVSLIEEKLSMFPWEVRSFLRQALGRYGKPNKNTLLKHWNNYDRRKED